VQFIAAALITNAAAYLAHATLDVTICKTADNCHNAASTDTQQDALRAIDKD
jgi:hypothetical protein